LFHPLSLQITVDNLAKLYLDLNGDATFRYLMECLTSLRLHPCVLLYWS
jgi:hypothetical protein